MIAKGLLRRKVTPGKALLPHKIPKDASSEVKRIFEKVEDRDERRELNLYITGYDEDLEGAETPSASAAAGAQGADVRRERPAGHDPRGVPHPMKVAYWPGCVSRGFTPELHGSMAHDRPAARHRARRARPRVLLRRRRHRRAQPGARRHAERAHVRAGPAGRGATDDEHLLDLPGRADASARSASTRTREYRAHVNENLAEYGLEYEKGVTNKNLLWLLVEDFGLDELRKRVKRPLTDLKVGPFYGCYIVRPTDRLGIDDEYPRDTYLALLIEALGGTVIEYAGAHKCCGFPIITMNKEASLKQAGRHLGDAADADADCLVTPCPLCHLNLDLQQPLAERVDGPRAEHAGPAPPAARRPGPRPGARRSSGSSRHVVKPTSVIDWTTSVVAGVDDGSGALAASA